MTEKKYTAQDIQKIIKIFCCHTSGMHDPVHFQERRYICKDQKGEALERLCEALNINPKTQCDPECGWCEDYPEKKKGEGLPLFTKK